MIKRKREINIGRQVDMVWQNYKTPQSTFNSASFKIQRLNLSWSRVNTYWRAADFKGLRWELDIIWAELHTDADKKQREYFIKIDKALRDNDDNKKYISLIRKLWFFLFDVEKAQGLGKSYYDPASEEFD